MRKKIFFIAFIFLSLFLVTSNIFAQGNNNPIFNSSCGFPNTEYNKCCVQPNTDSPINIPIPSLDVKKMVQEKLNQYGLGFIGQPCYLGEPDTSSGECICVQNEPEVTPVNSYETLCENYFKDKPNHLNFCLNCVKSGGYYSGLGCVPINLANFISNYLLGRMIGLAGLLSLLCIIYSVFMMQTSQGSNEKLKKAQELLTSCILGLIFIIFSVFILKLIGVNILKIPGLS
jgi:hypothetical protein